MRLIDLVRIFKYLVMGNRTHISVDSGIKNLFQKFLQIVKTQSV